MKFALTLTLPHSQVFGHLSCCDLVAASLAQKHWQRASAADSLWRPLLLRYFDQSDPTDPAGSTLPTYYAAFRAFMSEYRDLGPSDGTGPAAYYLRARCAFSKIRSWLDSRVPAIAASLQPGATEGQISSAAERLGTGPWAPAARALFRVHDGQVNG